MLKEDIKTSDYVSIVVTHACNRMCPFCVDKYRGRNEFITKETLTRHLEFAKRIGVKDVLIVGGEPSLHPNIEDICKFVKEHGFNLILTTNYTLPDVIKSLDGIVDCFNISYYGQEILPIKQDYKSDLTLSVLLYKDRFKDVADLDDFISVHEKDFHIKFKTLEDCNEWTAKNKDVSGLINSIIPDKRIILFGMLETLVYRDCYIGLSESAINKTYEHSFKCQVDGEISKSWIRSAL